MTGALAASALVAVGVLSWMYATVPGRGDATPRRAAAGGIRPREADRVASPPGSDGRIARPARGLQLLVPAYIYPAGEGRNQWKRLLDAAGKVGLVLVVNPDSGPGRDRIPDYHSIIAEAARRGVTLVGYVNTTYGKRPAAQIKDDIDAWVRNYPRIGGFFFDQQPPEFRHAAYFADIAAYAAGRSATPW